MEPPRLIRAFPPQPAGAQRVALDRASFGLTYALDPLPGGCVLQRVETTIDFLRGDELLAAYEAMYWEYFRFAPAAREQRLDRHDFDLSRDGWGLDRINHLLRHHGLPAGGGPTRFRFQKRFLLGPADVGADAAVLHTTPGGGAFGYLAEAEGERPWLRLRLREQELTGAALPLPAPAAGRGGFLGALRFEAWERLEFGFATLSGELVRQGYQPFTRPTPLAE